MRHRVVRVVLLALLCALPIAAQPAAAHAADSRTYLLRERVCLLQAYVERYALQHYNYYPARATLRRGGPVTAPLWPRNPWTGAFMKGNGSIGDFTYAVAGNGLSYRLAARYPGGTIVLRGSVPRTRMMQNDHRTREGLELVQQYIEMWSRAHNGLYPAVAQVDADGSVGQQDGVKYWPHDPWFHSPMAQSKRWGDFTYTVNEGRTSYSITAHYSRGGTFTLRGTTATNPWQRLRLTIEDEVLKRDLDIVHGYVELYVARNGALPTAEALTPDGAVGQAHPDWPADATGAVFTQGAGLGHFTYTLGEGGTYTLSTPLAMSETPYVISDLVSPSAPPVARSSR